MRFAIFLSGGFTAMAVITSQERKLAKRTSVQCVPRCVARLSNQMFLRFSSSMHTFFYISRAYILHLHMYYILCKSQDHERLEETQMKKFLLLHE